MSMDSDANEPNPRDDNYASRYGTKTFDEVMETDEAVKQQLEAKRQSPYDGADSYAQQFGNRPTNPQRPLSSADWFGRLLAYVGGAALTWFIFRGILSFAKSQGGEYGMGGLVILVGAFLVATVIASLVIAIIRALFFRGK